MAERVRSSSFENRISFFAVCFQISNRLVVLLDGKLVRVRVDAKEVADFAITSISTERLGFLCFNIRLSTLVTIPPKSVAWTVDFVSFDRFLLPFSFADVLSHAPS